MAIVKEMNSKFGLTLSYHRIVAFNINYALKKAVLCVASYYTKEARANHSVPLEEVDIEIPLDDYPLFLNSNPLEQGYLWLKNNVEGFEDSIDDLDVIEEPTIIEKQPRGESIE